LQECQITCTFDKPFEEWRPLKKEGWRSYDDAEVTMRFEGETRLGKNKKVQDFTVIYSN
jgi:hypothetical protein